MEDRSVTDGRAGLGGLDPRGIGGRGGSLLRSSIGPYVGLATALILLVLALSVTQEAFLSADNITNIMRTMAVPLVLAAGMTLVLLTAGVDLSMGSILALTGVMYATLTTSGVPGEVALLAALATGAAIGFFINGLMIGRLGMSFFVVTLGTLALFRGITFLWTETNIDQYDDRLSSTLGNEVVLNDFLPIAFIVAIGVVLLVWFILRFTSYGRSVYAVGGNAEAAELSGIRSGWVVAGVYGISGLLAGLAAVLTIGRTTSAAPTAATGIELQVAAAALLGGVALSGGVGSIWGTVLGVAFLEVLNNGLNIAGFSSYWQQVFTGLVLLAAITLDWLRNRRA